MATLKEIIELNSMRWIIVGGRTGVGKTTFSCSLAAQLSKVRDSVLLVSIDAPHKISHTFDQNFSTEPTKVQGFDNLYAMELDLNALCKKIDEGEDNETKIKAKRVGKCVAKYLIHSFYGYNDSVKYAEILKVVQEKNISVVVLDTGMTTDAYRFVSFIHNFHQGFGQLFHDKSRFSYEIVSQSPFLEHFDFSYDVFSSEMDQMLDALTDIRHQFQDPGKTRFIYVDDDTAFGIMEVLNAFSHIRSLGMYINDIVINKFRTDAPYPEDEDYRDSLGYLEMIPGQFDTYCLTRLPFDEGVSGVAGIKSFSEYLVTPYVFEFDGINVNEEAVNGFNINDLDVDGLDINGLNMNGLDINDVDINGIDINGLDINIQNIDGQEQINFLLDPNFWFYHYNPNWQ